MTVPLPRSFSTALAIPRDRWDRAPWNRFTFQRIREVLPTTEVWRGGEAASVLPDNRQDLDHLQIDLGGGRKTRLAQFLEDAFTDGFIVVHRGRIVHERYLNGMTERTLHLSQSVAKSITATIAGCLIGDGLIDPAAPLTEYVPELAATAYVGATVQHVLDMTSGVRFSEEYTDPVSDIGKTEVASGWKPVPADAPASMDWPATVFEQIMGLTTREAEHGSRFLYRSIETDVLAHAMQRASGQPFADLVSARLWQRIGAEESAAFTVDPSGYPLADGGFNATLRDYARFGLVHLGLGLFNGRQIVPADWVIDTRRGAHGLFNDVARATLPNGRYRNQFWIEDAGREVTMARGVFGQLIYIDPAHELVIVKLASHPDFVNTAVGLDSLAACHAIAAALQ